MADTCPKCGQIGVGSDRCPACGVVIALYEQHGPVQIRAFSDWRQLVFHGTGRELMGVWAVSGFLTLVTLGVYYFWAKTRIRQYLYAHTEIAGDRFAYHGTGQELLIGFLKALLIFIIPMVALANGPEILGLGPVAMAMGALAALGLAMIFTPVAMVAARRYRLSRTSWRGIRFSFRGEMMTFLGHFLLWSLYTGLTFGLYYPVYLVRRYEYLTDHSFFGTARFRFLGEPRGLMGPYLRLVAAVGVTPIVAGVLAVTSPQLGVAALVAGLVLAVVAWLGWSAEKRRFLWNHTRLAGARFQCSVTGGGLAQLYLGNAALLISTLGVAMPWVKARNAAFLCEHLALVGPVDIDAIAQDARRATATGEGLATVFDSDIGIG